VIGMRVEFSSEPGTFMRISLCLAVAQLFGSFAALGLLSSQLGQSQGSTAPTLTRQATLSRLEN